MDKTLLTLSQVEAWKKRAAELESSIQQAELELASTRKKLEAASMFMDAAEAAPVAPPMPEYESGPQTTETLGDRIVRIAGSYPAGAEPSEIRDSLRAEGYDMKALDANSSYLYTSISRLVKRGRLEKRRGKYRAPQKNPSQDGTGAVAAPVRH